MISSFDLEKLDSLLKDFYTLTRIRITVFDETFRELTAFPKQIAPFCQIVRTDPFAEVQCHRCDQTACETASRRHASYTYRCHAGLTESITPLYLGNVLIGYLFFGHVFPYPSYEDGWREIQKLCSVYHLDLEALERACRKLPMISEDYITSASHILQAVASFLCLERMAVLRREELPVQIDQYISKHFTEELCAHTICEHFQIGKTYLYKIAKQCYGIGIAEHIRNLRIEKAKALLTEEPEMYMDEIAQRCGFRDYNYFITVFKRMVGVPPGEYRVRKKVELGI